MKTRIVTDREEFRRLKDDWNDLLSRSPANHIYLTWEWLFTWWECFGDANRQLHIVLFTDAQGKLVGIAPFIVTRKKRLPLFPATVLEFLGTGEDEADEVCSNYMDVIAADGNEEVRTLAARTIRDGLEKGLWQQVSFKGVPQLPAGHYHLNGAQLEQEIRTSSCAVIDLPRQWDEYMPRLSKKWRDQIKRGRKELARLGEVSSANVTAPEEIPAAFNEFIRLHQKKWETPGRSGLFSSRRFLDFHKKVLTAFAEKKWAAIHLLKCDGRIVAASYKFEYNGNVYFYLPAYDTDVKTKIGLGLIERSYDIEGAIRAGFRCYDFYRAGEKSYKWHLAKDRRDVADVILYRKDWTYRLWCQLKKVKSVGGRAKALCRGKQI